MNDLINRGKQRMKVDKLEIRDYNLQRIITDALVDKGYDVDIKPIKDGFNGPQGQELNIYEVRR